MSREFSIAVVGCGAAGIAAAITAARAGHATLLFDKLPGPGGTGGFSGLTTLCGLYDEEGRFLNDGFTREFADTLSDKARVKMGRVWVLPYQSQRFRDVSASFISSLSNLQPHWNTPVTNLVINDSRIMNINGFSVGAVIDCSGTAEVARAIGAECLATDENTQAPAVIFPLRNVHRALNTLADAAQVLLPLARAGLPAMSFQPAAEPDVVNVKFTGSPDQVPQIIRFIRHHISGFEQCEAGSTKPRLSNRAGRMILGEYLLTGADVLTGRKFPDAAACCAWPIEQWNAAGRATFQYLPSGACYEIPARALRAARVENLFMGGKTISADVDAIASARVMGCCLATGVAAAGLAAQHLKSARTHDALF